jgi:hypothetical protein
MLLVKRLALVLLAATLLVIVCCYAAFTPRTAGTKILLVSANRLGENETIARLKIATRRLKINLHVVHGNNDNDKKNILHNETQVQKAMALFKPDFLLVIEDIQPYQAGLPNYMSLTLGEEAFLKEGRNGPILINREHYKFDALLPSFKDIERLKQAVERSNRIFIGFPWYPTVYSSNYQPAIPQKLFYTGGILWDDQRGSEKYKALFSMLDNSGYLETCGDQKTWTQYTPSSYVGLIPFDGSSLIAALHKAGVSLVLHSKQHLKSAAPTARIFEAAAANAVIITDKHPFIQQYFGKNVLYIDITQDAAGIFKQIDQHMQWIRNNPKQAQKMANNCHNIFNRNFTLEKQLKRLVAMHNAYLNWG